MSDRLVNGLLAAAFIACCAATAPAVDTVIRGPYLQMASPSVIVVRWRTNNALNGRVRYGTVAGSLTANADQAAVGTDHEVAITGLTPSTRYYYSVGTTTATIAGDATYTFVTTPVTGTPKATRVWVLGDPGTGNANQVAVRDSYATYAGGVAPDLWLMLGDNAYNSGLDSEYQTAVFDMYPSTLRQSALWPTLGNHDTAQATTYVNTYPYFSIFTLPTAAEAGGTASGTEHYYSFDHGNIHFLCLDSMTADRSPGGAMLTWAQSDLAATNAHWIIAFWHHPPYTKGSHDSDTETALIEMRANALPILEAGGVDLVLCGHSHSYERSYLLDGHYGLSTTLTPAMKLNAGSGASATPYTKPQGSRKGAVYAVAGSSGQTAGGSLNHPAMYVSLNNLGSVVLDIHDNRIDGKFLRETAAVTDAFTIEKETPPTIAVAASAATPVTTTTTAVAVLGADDAGETALVYTWSTTGTPPAPVSFSPNGTNAAKSATATFAKAGSYSLRVTVSDQGGNTVTSTVAVTVVQTQTSVTVLPSNPTIAPGSTQQFSASARDQFNLAMSTQPAFTWSASGAGAISAGGLFTAGGSTGAATVSVTGGGSSGSVNVTVGAGGSGTSTAGSGSGGSGGSSCGLGTGFAAVMGLLIALRHARRQSGRAQNV